jgi:hypothetical protein
MVHDAGLDSFILDRVPNRIHFGQLHFAQFPAARFEFVLQSIEAGDEFVSGRLDRGFCVDFALPRQVYDGEQQIANLVFDPLLLL